MAFPILYSSRLHPVNHASLVEHRHHFGVLLVRVGKLISRSQIEIRVGTLNSEILSIRSERGLPFRTALGVGFCAIQQKTCNSENRHFHVFHNFASRHRWNLPFHFSSRKKYVCRENLLHPLRL